MRPLKAILFLFLIALQPVWATEPFGFDTTFVASAATSEVAAVADTIAARPAKKKDIFSRFLAYFNDANKEKKNKRFDFSVIGGPHYSSDTKFGIGLVAAGLYRSDPTDSLSAPSNVSLFGDVSTVGFTCSVCAARISFRATPTASTTPSTSIPSLATSGDGATTWAMWMATRVR